jgi:hypothetical protein
MLDDFRAIARNTRRALKSGKTIPVLLKHDDSTQGDPVDPSEVDAREREGKLVGTRLTKSGELAFTFDVPDETDVAQRIRDGRIEFSSPSFGHYRDYQDGKERDWGIMTRHLALTPFPRDTDQSPIKEVLNFAESSDSPVTLNSLQIKRTKMQEELKQPAADETKKAEQAEQPQVDENQLKELLSAAGIVSPNASFIDNPVAWATQLISTLQQAVAKLASNQRTSGAISATMTPESHAQLAYNFSEHTDPLVRKLFEDHQKLETKHKQRVRETAMTGIKQRIDQPWIPTSVKTSLLNRLDTLNFSEGTDGAATEDPSMTVTEVVEMLEQAVPENTRLTTKELVAEAHPSGDAFYNDKSALSATDENLTLAQAEKIVDRFQKSSVFTSPV